MNYITITSYDIIENDFFKKLNFTKNKKLFSQILQEKKALDKVPLS